MLFRFCTCKKLRPRPRGIRVQGGTRRQRRAAEWKSQGEDEMKSQRRAGGVELGAFPELLYPCTGLILPCCQPAFAPG